DHRVSRPDGPHAPRSSTRRTAIPAPASDSAFWRNGFYSLSPGKGSVSPRVCWPEPFIIITAGKGLPPDLGSKNVPASVNPFAWTGTSSAVNGAPAGAL